MSDKFKIIGVGGAGINNIPPNFVGNSIKISSDNFKGFEELKKDISNLGKIGKSFVISSPAGNFSSYVLPEILRTLRDRSQKIILISIEPFGAESNERRERANKTLRDVKKYVDTLIRVDNDNFVSSMEKAGWVEMLDRVNSYISKLIQGLIEMNENIPEAKELGLYSSYGENLEDLEKNIVYSSSKNIEGMVGSVDIRKLDDLKMISEYIPMEVLSYRFANKLSISGVLLYSGKDNFRSLSNPSAHGIRIH